MTAVRKSLAFTSLDSYVGMAFQLASTVVIARILTPEQTGVFAVAAVFAALASTLRDFGVAEYLIQERALDDDAIRAALAVNIAISWAMALLMLLLAPAAAAFYRSPGVADVMRVQAVNFVFIPFGAVTMAWFRREMDFRPMFVAGLLSSIASFAVATILALRGWGYMSLAWSSLAGVLVTVSVSIWMRPPSLPRWPGLKGIGRVLHFGKFASGIYIFGQAGKGAPEMIVGRAQDMASVGMLSRAFGIVEIFNRLIVRAVVPVCLPYFAKGVRERGTALPGLLIAMSYLTAVGWTFLLFLGLAAFPAVRILYGPQWLEAVPLARILCGAAAVELLYLPAKEALLAVGEVKRANNLQMLTQGLRVLGLLAAVPFGLEGACWGLLAGSGVGALVCHRILARTCGLTFGDAAEAACRSAGGAIIACAPMMLWTLTQRIEESNYVRVAMVGGLVTAVMWPAALRLLRHPLWLEFGRIATAIGARRSRAGERP